jgi:hypothetical protein
MRADKVYLISYRPDDVASPYLAKIKATLFPKYKQIQIEEDFIDLWNLYDCIAKFKEIVGKETGNLVYINVSTGTKVTAIAGTIVSMLLRCTPYYAKVNYGPQQLATPPTEFVEDPFEVPVYRIMKPRAQSIAILQLITESGGVIRKKELIQKLIKAGLIRSATKRELTPSAAHNQLRGMLQPLVKDWLFVNIESRGRTSNVTLTEHGKTALRIFA